MAYRFCMESHQKITEKYFHLVLKKYRAASGLTQEEFSERAGMSKSFYSMMELGRRWPNIDRLFEIAKAFGVRPGELIDALEEEAKKK